MANVALSVIIPCKNNKDRLIELIRRVSRTLEGTEVELIIIDMNSSDNSVIAALNELKNHNLRGCVIQSGGGTITSALNTGIYKSDGKYLTFVFMSRLYKNYMNEYLQTAEKEQTDLVFAVPSFEGESAGSVAGHLNTGPVPLKGTELLSELIHSHVYFDFTAVLLRRDYLLGHHIKFYEDCNFGYAEAFIYNVLLCDPKVSCADIRLERDEHELNVRDEGAFNASCYSRIEAMLKVFENAQLLHMENKGLLELFEYRKLPSVVMGVVDILKKENFSYSAIKKSLRQKGYDKLLKTSAQTPPSLRKRIFLWKTLPWYYRPL